MIENLIAFIELGDVGVGSISGLLGALIGALFTYLQHRSKNSSQVEIAKINSTSSISEAELETLRKEIKEIKQKLAEERESNAKNIEVIKYYENLLRHYRFIFKLAYQMINPKLEGDSEVMVLLDEVKSMFAEDFKLK